MKNKQEKTDIKAQQPKQKDYASLASLLYLTVGIFILKYYRYQINPDGISYISIARKYAAGNFSEAINGYWGPLYSWLLAPFLVIGVEPLLATKILNLLIGFVIILILALTARGFSISAATRRAMLIASIPMTLLFSMIVITPDLLVVLVIFTYFLFVFKTDYAASKRSGILCGLFGGILYLTKSYGFPLFIIHFTFMNIFHYLRTFERQDRIKIAANFIYGFIAFGIISGIWITALSLKYHKFTYSTVGGEHIMAYIRPGGRNLEPMSYQGFLELPNKTAICAWEDPSYFTYPKWSPLQSADDFDYYTGYIQRNVRKCYNMIKDFSYFSVPICIAGILILLQRPGKILSQRQILYPFISLLLYSAGYCMVIVERRYIWVTFFLILMMGGYIIDKLLENDFFTRTRKIAIYIFFIIAFAYRPAVIDLPAQKDEGKPYYLLSEELKKHIHPGDRMASNEEWNISSYLAYYLNVPYYGIPKSGIDKETLNKELHKFNINRYLIWQNGELVNIENVP
jgi:hypothetical protein